MLIIYFFQINSLDPRMYMALKNYISNITQTPGLQLKVYAHFASASLCSRFGCWGLIESSDANLYLSPKYMAYHDAINSAQTCSWDERANTCPGNNTCIMSERGICGKSTAISTQNDRCYCYFGYELDSNGTCQVKYIESNKCTYQVKIWIFKIISHTYVCLRFCYVY